MGGNIAMDKEKPSWKEVLRTTLSIPIVIMGIGFMALSFHLAILGGLSYSPEAMTYGRLQAIHNMLISIGLFLLAILIRVW